MKPTKFSNKKLKKYLLLFPLCLLLFVFAMTLSIYISQEITAQKNKQQYLESLSTESYNGIFLSMHSLNNYAAEDFTTYRGLATILSPYAISNLEEMSEYIDAALRSGNSLSQIYLGLDPYLMWKATQENNDKWNENLEQYLLSYINAYPEITFEIMLPYPSLEYWVDTKVEKRETILTTYRTLICSLEPYANAITYFAGAEHWLIANPGNYEEDFITNSQISQKLMLLTFCDHHLQITATDADFVLNNLRIIIENEQQAPSDYPDLSQWQLVFFGDSVVGNYTGSASIPGVVNGLTDATTYNFAFGGTQATYNDDEVNSFLQVTDSFLSKELTVTQDDTTFAHSDTAAADSKLCFILHYGLNDYFSGRLVSNQDDPYDIHSYTGALRTGIKQLQEAYPNATILLMTPPYCTYFSYGKDTNSHEGGVLTDYVDAVVQVAKDMNVPYLNLYTELGINETNYSKYLADGCHMNETGRFVTATHIIEALSSQ